MIIVTGGAGFIGSNLVRQLARQTGEALVVVDELHNGHKFVNLADLPIADYLDKDEFADIIEHKAGFARDITAIFHQGACSVTTEWDGRYMMQNNFSYSKLLLQHSLAHAIPFIYASSAAVYGASKDFAETPANEQPLNVYAYSKLLFDQYVRRISLSPRQQVVGLRYFNVYGPREEHKGSMASVAYHFRQQILESGVASLFAGNDGYADGEQLRDFVYVDDVAAVNLWFLEHREQSGVYNVGTGKAQSFNAVANAVVKSLGRGEIRYIPFPEHLQGAYQSYTQADLENLRSTGCAIEFKTVEAGVADYMKTLDA